jgi:hypothetical protein
MDLWLCLPGLSVCVVFQPVIHPLLDPFQEVVLCPFTAMHNTGMELIEIPVSGSLEETRHGIDRKRDQCGYLQRETV